jgi:hypothetical protein
MEHTKRIVEKNPLLRKGDLIVITGASGKIAGVKMNRKYDLDAPKGVVGRNSDNTFIKKIQSRPSSEWTLSERGEIPKESAFWRRSGFKDLVVLAMT